MGVLEQRTTRLALAVWLNLDPVARCIAGHIHLIKRESRTYSALPLVYLCSEHTAMIDLVWLNTPKTVLMQSQSSWNIEYPIYHVKKSFS